MSGTEKALSELRIATINMQAVKPDEYGAVEAYEWLQAMSDALDAGASWTSMSIAAGVPEVGKIVDPDPTPELPIDWKAKP